MTEPAPGAHDPGDPYDLARFVAAQEGVYPQALAEIRTGRKRTHWMWFIFPQIDGLGVSSTSRRYAIKGPDEARAYLDHRLLGPRLVECIEAVLQLQGRSATEIFGSPDDLKLRSCATLFGSILPQGSAFHRVLEKYFPEGPDGKTLELLRGPRRSPRA